MCGIAGIFKLNGAMTPEEIEAVQRMMDAQVHRGPDGSGLYRDGRVVLGHRRLSILDLSEAGRQPMSNEDGTVWITYNGEIYNFQELREALMARGHRFRSNLTTNTPHAGSHFNPGIVDVAVVVQVRQPEMDSMALELSEALYRRGL